MSRNSHIVWTLYVIVVAGWISVIWMFLGMSAPPGPSSGSVPGGGTVGHLFLFGVLGLLVSAGILILQRSGRPTAALIPTLLVGGLVALLTEWYQSTVSARSGNLEDGLTDVIGTMVGALLVWMMRLWLTRQARFRVSDLS